MDEKNILDEPPEDKKIGGQGKFSLGEAMMNKKHLNKAREDLKRVKTIVSEQQIFIQ